jgi:hypothetical protein
VQVATCLGVVATGSFHHVLSTVIAPWARSKYSDHREAAAYALSVPAADPRLLQPVQHLVRSWLGEGDGSRLRATAVRTLGQLVAVGVEPPDKALTWFDGVATEAGPQLVQALAAAFCDLLVADAVRFALPVLERLIRWLDDPRRADTARLTFLLVAHDLVTEQRPAADAPVIWPTLLWLAIEAQDQRQNLVHLWCRVLGDGPHADVAELVLAGWAERAEPDPAMREAFARMVRIVGGTSLRARAILQRCSRIWRGDGEAMPLPEVARLVELVLSS